jgi:hypothetical protein
VADFVSNSQELKGSATLAPTQYTQFATYASTDMVLQIVNQSKHAEADYTATSSGPPWSEKGTLSARGQQVYGPMNFTGTPVFVMNTTNPNYPADLYVVLGGLDSSLIASAEQVAAQAPRDEPSTITTFSLPGGDQLNSTSQALDGEAALRPGQMTEFATLGGAAGRLTVENVSDETLTYRIRNAGIGLDFTAEIDGGRSAVAVPPTDQCGGRLQVTVLGAGDGTLRAIFEAGAELAGPAVS